MCRRTVSMQERVSANNNTRPRLISHVNMHRSSTHVICLLSSYLVAARNYLQLHLLVALCLLVVSILATRCCLDNKRRRDPIPGMCLCLSLLCSIACARQYPLALLPLRSLSSSHSLGNHIFDLTLASSLERQVWRAHMLAGAFAGLGPPVPIVSMAAPVFSGMSSSAWVPTTLCGVFQMKMAPSVPAVTMNFWFGEMAICYTNI